MKTYEESRADYLKFWELTFRMANKTYSNEGKKILQIISNKLNQGTGQLDLTRVFGTIDTKFYSNSPFLDSYNYNSAVAIILGNCLNTNITEGDLIRDFLIPTNLTKKLNVSATNNKLLKYNIKYLKFIGNILKKDNLYSLVQPLIDGNNNKLESLNLSSCTIDDEGAKILSQIFKKNTTLKAISLSNNPRVTNIGLLSIVQALKDSKNTTFNNLTKNDGKNILQDTTLDQLIKILTPPPPTTQNAEVARVLNYIEQNSFGRWFLEKQSITSIGAQVIATTIINNNKDGPQDTATNINVSLLNLNDNNIGDEGAKIIATALIQNRTLTNLNLSNNNIGDVGAKAIANALIQNTKLTGLNLSFNKIGNEGALAIINALKINKKLIKLDLSDNKIDDELVKEIAIALKQNAPVENFSEHNKNNKKNNKNNNIIIVSIILLLVIIAILTIILLK